MGRNKLALTSVVLAAALAAPVGARAQEAEAPARMLFDRADAAYAEGRYEAALALFQESYELSHRPALLYNLANTLERLGRTTEAIARLEEFLPHAPSTMRDVVERRIAALQAREAERVRQEQARRAAEQASAVREASPLAPAPGATPVALAPRPREVRERTVHGSLVGPIALLGTGVAAAAVGVGFGLDAQARDAQAREDCRQIEALGTLCEAAAEGPRAQARTSAITADVAFAVSGVAAVAGAVWTALQLRTTHRERVVVRIVPLPGGFAIGGQL